MIYSEAKQGDVFLISADTSKRPFLKVSDDKYVDLFVRTEHEATEHTEILVISMETLTVLMHRDEVTDWVDKAKEFYIPKQDEDDSTDQTQEQV